MLGLIAKSNPIVIQGRHTIVGVNTEALTRRSQMVGNVTIGARVSVSGRDGENGTAWWGVLQHHHLMSKRKYWRPSFPAALLFPLSL